MTKGLTRGDYDARLDRVRDHIYDHLDEDLDFARLAEVACLSPHHWHRIYHALHGETVFATVRRLRLQRAAYELKQTTLSVERIAARAKYDSAAAFSRVFKEKFGMPPARYRREGGYAKATIAQPLKGHVMQEIGIRQAPALTVAGIPHRGPYMEIGRAFDQLHNVITTRGLYGPGQHNVAVYFDEAAITPPEKCRSLAGRSVGPQAPIEPPLERLELAAGEHAVLRHRGPYAELGAAYDWLFGVWLPGSGREAADRPCYEIYINTPMDAAPKDLITDIYLPLK
ncbi:MAG: AraC family transcriptional regulator [Methylobacteriaceae bacterium]|nr:AraC family transcriptional regulator [Methylobacteriaceae bacterium]HPG03466.1 AraC family transcriptional regulator [Rhodoblastus sp.]